MSIFNSILYGIAGLRATVREADVVQELPEAGVRPEPELRPPLDAAVQDAARRLRLGDALVVVGHRQAKVHVQVAEGTEAQLVAKAVVDDLELVDFARLCRVREGKAPKSAHVRKTMEVPSSLGAST